MIRGPAYRRLQYSQANESCFFSPGGAFIQPGYNPPLNAAGSNDGNGPARLDIDSAPLPPTLNTMHSYRATAVATYVIEWRSER